MTDPTADPDAADPTPGDGPTRPAWMYRQSAALPYRWRDGELQVLLITSLKRRRWIVPKGIVEPGLGPVASAVKEAEEEAGVEGVVEGEPLGSYEHAKWGGVCTVAVYPLRVTRQLDEWPESVVRSRRWVSVAEAVVAVEKEPLRDLIARLPDGLGPRAPG